MEIQKKEVKRNEWLDALKLFASFMVVFVHVGFSGKVGVLVNAIARFAVPMFFAISGFFTVKSDLKTIKRRLVKILVLYIIATIVYHLISIVVVVINNGPSGIVLYFKEVFIGKNIWKFFVFNLPFSSVHLWYLLSLIYVYLIWMAIIRFSVKDKAILILAIMLLTANIVLGEGFSIFGVYTAPEYTRNFVLMGFPFFAFGYLVGKNKEKLMTIKTKWFVLAIVVGLLESILSRYFFQSKELYIGSAVVCFSLLLIAIKYSDKKANGFIRCLSTTSTDIYIYHPAISICGLTILSRVLNLNVSNIIFRNIWPILLCVLTIAFSLIKNLIVSKIKNQKQKKSR